MSVRASFGSAASAGQSAAHRLASDAIAVVRRTSRRREVIGAHCHITAEDGAGLSGEPVRLALARLLT
jgi:hypothetical protein